MNYTNTPYILWKKIVPLLISFRDNKALLEVDARYGFIELCLKRLVESRSQLLQDIFVLYALREKRNGFFIEFGAASGLALSNTYLLEKNYGWSGILAEPSRVWHPSLSKRDRNCVVDFRCVTNKSGGLVEFTEAVHSELSTMSAFADRDNHAAQRRTGISYAVETVSLVDLLDQHHAPIDIDYLSIDTEGSEFMVLSAFDFSQYRIKIITVEHNYCSPDRENIFDHLTSNGFERVFEGISQFDDWYINRRYFQAPRGM